MSATLMSARLKLVRATPEQLLAKWQAPDGTFHEAISPAWIEKLHAAREPDPWVLGFLAFDRETDAPIGSGGFRGEPGADGIVEIAYGIDEGLRLQGYATEVAEALVAFAFNDPRVRLVCAHTFPGGLASARVLEKCGFTRVPDVIDPEDGLVWRFEKGR
jgi:RimJ/RimL family protein N-acetyltransferase